MANTHWSGTVASSNMAHHGGKYEGAGELTFGSGPGKAASRVKTKEESFGIDKGGKDCKKGKK